MRYLTAGLIAIILTGCASTTVDSPAIRAGHDQAISAFMAGTTTPPPSSTTSTTVPPATVVLSTGDPAPVSDDCWIGLARQVGWPEDTLGTLARIIHRESRCDPTVWADRPSTLDNSRGLLQMNAYGTLEGAIRSLCGINPVELFDPATNLRCGLAYYQAAGWAPWGGSA